VSGTGSWCCGPALTALASTVAGRRADLSALHTEASAHPELQLHNQWEAVATADDALHGGAGTPATRVVLAAALANLITQVGNTSNLILDPDLDSFYVMDTLVVQVPRSLVAAAAATM
jgi:hypothetical protein